MINIRSIAHRIKTALPGLKRTVAYGYFLRVPITIAITVFLFPLLATTDGLGAYLIGMYDIGQLASLCAGGAGFLLWLALTVSTRTIFETGLARFGVALPSNGYGVEFPLAAYLRVGKVVRATAIAAAFYGFAVIWLLSGLIWLSGRVWTESDQGQGWSSFVFAIFGFVGVLLIVWIALWVRKTRWMNAAIEWALLWTKITPEGYRQGGQENGPIEDVHKLAFTLMSIAFVLFLSLGWLYPGNPIVDLKTLPCVMLILTNTCWLLASISYLFDNWRIPLSAIFIIFALAGSIVGDSSDHVYPLRACADNCQPTVNAIDILDQSEGNPIIVATSGGGILASAWTARVLGELERANPGKFSSSIRLISAVSGGSVGTMYFINRLRKEPQLEPDGLFDDAARSSLDAVAWGLTYSDSLRTFRWYRSIFGQQRDRAQAMRNEWTRKHPVLDNEGLSFWQAGQTLSSGNKMPAIIFNSTVDETGERFLFANYKVNIQKSGVDGVREFFGVKDFFNEFLRKTDIDIKTAVSLSAAFPYVSPAARADTSDQSKWFHLVDGGYYDNYGVASALDFLKDADANNPPNRPIMVVLIEATPAKYYTQQARPDRSWGFQLIAPPTGLIGMWQIAARARNSASLDWMKTINNNFKVVHFVYEGEDYPTSWHLTKKQMQMIKDQLMTPFKWTCDNRNSFEAVNKFLGNTSVLPVCKAEAPAAAY